MRELHVQCTLWSEIMVDSAPCPHLMISIPSDGLLQCSRDAAEFVQVFYYMYVHVLFTTTVWVRNVVVLKFRAFPNISKINNIRGFYFRGIYNS